MLAVLSLLHPLHMVQDGVLAEAALDFRTRAIDERSLVQAADETAFVVEALRCLSDLRRPVRAVAAVRRYDERGQPRGMTRDEAIVAGSIVRLAKLHDFMLEPTVHAAAERFFVLWRPTIESCVNTIYFCRNAEPGVLAEFVSYSLRFEKQMLGRVHEDVGQTSQPSPIQRRMLRDMPEAFIRADVDPAEVDASSRRDWSGQGGIYGRFRAIGWQGLYPLFQIASHYVHGNWHDLSVHHLGTIPSTEGYQPALELSPLRPQPVTAAVRLLAEAAREYLTYAVAPSESREIVDRQLRHPAESAHRLDVLHEQWLVERA